MFKHILVPIDLGDQNEATLRTAGALAEQNRARVTLLHVIHAVAFAPHELRPFYRRLMRISDRRLAQAAKPFAARGIEVKTEVRIGEPVHEIVRAAGAGVDLLVMGSHAVDPSRRASRPTRGWGTISYRVGLLCPCPILLVKRNELRIKRNELLMKRGDLPVKRSEPTVRARRPARHRRHGATSRSGLRPRSKR
jgi:nucleotide-binding universal stress UspA family protein